MKMMMHETFVCNVDVFHCLCVCVSLQLSQFYPDDDDDDDG